MLLVLSQKGQAVAETQLHLKPSNASLDKIVWGMGGAGSKRGPSLGSSGKRAQTRLRDFNLPPKSLVL